MPRTPGAEGNLPSKAPSKRKRPASPALRAHASKVLGALVELYPSVRCALDYRYPFELVVATILSAQCTDVRVNLVTPELFRRFPDPPRLAVAELAEVEAIVYPTGFYRAKAKNLVAMARGLVDRHGGEVPRDLDALTSLPGVGRKTANVVLGNAYGIASGVVVDTHVKRLSTRLGLTRQPDPVRIEADLNALIPRDQWIDFSHRLIAHGRATCLAGRPRCPSCALSVLCPRVGLEPLAAPAR